MFRLGKLFFIFWVYPTGTVDFITTVECFAYLKTNERTVSTEEVSK